MNVVFVELLFAFEREISLKDCAKRFFRATEIPQYEERNSSNYVDETYYKAQTEAFICKLSFADVEGYEYLPFSASFQLADYETDSAIQIIETLAKTRLLPAGFHVARIADPNKPHSQRFNL